MIDGFDTVLGGFVHESAPMRVVFRAGSLADVPSEVDRLGAQRVLLVSGGPEAAFADRLAVALGNRLAARFTDVVMHVPVEVARAAAQAAKESNADLVVCLGGGSATGAAKAIALESGLPILAVPTTYAGSEMTAIWGMTENGRKTVGRDPRVQPRVVVYDPELTMSLPIDLSAASAMNAMAHLVEGLYAPGASPITSLVAEEGVRALATAMPLVVIDPNDIDARSLALYGAWLAGWTLAVAGMGIHHKICHVVGGNYDLPHAGVHSAVLPYAMAYNAEHAAPALARAQRALTSAGIDAPDPATGIWLLEQRIGAPTNLADIGLAEVDIPTAANDVVAAGMINPRPVERDAIEQLLRDAWSGVPPRRIPSSSR
jgi:maleylacetate reductase